MLSQLAACGSCCVKVALGVVLGLALTAVHNLGVNWEKTITDVDIYTIQDPRFWGPMTMLVPRNCTKLKLMMKGRRPSRKSRLTNATNMLAAPPATIPKSILGYVELPDTDILSLVAVHKCGETIEALDVTWSQYYFSAMMIASSDFDINAMHLCRMRLFWLFAYAAVFRYLIDLSSTTSKTVTKLRLRGALEEEEASQERSCCQKASSMLTDAPRILTEQLWSKFKTTMQQLGFVSLFVTFWHEDHYLMNYFPARAWVIWTLFFQVREDMEELYQQCVTRSPPNSEQIAEMQRDFEILQDPEADADANLQVLQHVLRDFRSGSLWDKISSCWEIFAIPCATITFPVVSLPIIGWTFYNWQFMFKLFEGDYCNEVAFNSDFPSMQRTLGVASKHVIGINLLDIIASYLAEAVPAALAL